MHIATPAALVRAIIEHTNQTFPFKDNHTTLFHRAATRFSLQEDKEVITCGISRCKLGFLVESRFWVMPYSFSCPVHAPEVPLAVSTRHDGLHGAFLSLGHFFKIVFQSYCQRMRSIDSPRQSPTLD